MEIRGLTHGDVPTALTLCRSAGWNQVADDWTRLIDHEPLGCFAAQIDGRLVGTVTTTTYGKDLAWIGMMLVDHQFRRRGIATRLMTAALQYLRENEIACVKLDATPAGQPVYERLGFQAEWQFHRWSRHPMSPKTAPERAELTSAHLDLDRKAFGADRSAFLAQLQKASQLCVSEAGFGMMRAGHNADYLGPVIADDLDTAREIVLGLLPCSTKTIYWDPPQVNANAVSLAQSLGFEPIRVLTRMWIGSRLPDSNTDLQFALTDPGTG